MPIFTRLATLVAVTADTFNVKLTDFGEARARKPDKTMTQVGTPIFIAPEVMRGDRYDERCDVFSFAICLVDMLQVSNCEERSNKLVIRQLRS